MSASRPPLVDRIYGFDLIRIVTALAILYFHVWQYSFFQDQISFPPEISSYHLLVDVVGVFFKYGGLFIVALSFFLIGLKAKSQHVNRVLILLVGIFGLQILSSENPADPGTWDWDVYSYLVLSYFFVMIITKKTLPRWGLVILSILALSIPYEIYGPLLKIPEAVQFTGWNAVPWLALPILFNSLGLLWREKVPGAFLKLHTLEWPAWIALMIVFFAMSPDYGPFPAGPGFEGYIFKQKPLMFWQHFTVFMFLLRLSLDPRINHVLKKIKPVRWISSLKWNERFGFCYLLQFALLPLGPTMVTFWVAHPRLFEWLWFLIFVGTEVSARIVLNGKEMFKRLKAA